jgi:hypothetical protein
MALRQTSRATVLPSVVVIALAALVASSAAPAVARGGHGFGRGGHEIHADGMHGAHMAGGRGNDAYAKAASQELDKVLNSQVKSICRGC